ncbi:heavy-metal-associated domain-containing protein [Roseisolibacter sp. H3M3-2]|uniref:heavy-metal-associated domain-containing protein n=1 Tax=Roseisolibacter sp. H3M3-2 TaxID=3031323 RepID=UPI0023DB5F63|nr:heavy-metal-associated domain-containing protein [Roseisolibacter sp. H3M3-2]MDF1504119.1 heavy-metal-associated domain-containing protein [Roseisolibacter sp. H3M3-2]
MSTIKLEVEGMSCGHCVKSVRDALAEVPDVAVERVDLGSATVVTYAETPAGVEERLVEALRDAGYDGRVATNDAASQ